MDIPRASRGNVSPDGNKISENILTVVHYSPSTSGPAIHMSTFGNMWRCGTLHRSLLNGVIEHEVYVALEVRIRRNESTLTQTIARKTHPVEEL